MSLWWTLNALCGCFGLASAVAPAGADSGDTAAADTGGPPDDTGAGDCRQSGVANAGTSWSLPAGFPAGTFTKAADATPTADPSWAFVDVDGNGRTDLLVTRFDDAAVEGLGSSSWLYYSNTGAMFRTNSASWALPAGYPDGTFATPYDLSLSTSPAWVRADLDGDGKLDLVVTEDRASSEAGLSTTLWLVYQNTGSGYSSSPTSWSLPAGFSNGSLNALTDTNPAEPTWALLDVNADGRSDFVVTHDDSTEGLGTTLWQVYLNNGSGFASSATDWLLPEGFPARTFDRVYDDDPSTAPSWGLLDIDGNGRIDLVVTRDDDAGVSGLGTSSWLYHSNTGSRFRTEGVPWTFPDSYPTNAFQTLTDADPASPSWAIADLDRDGLLDLVITRDDDAGIDELGTLRWQLFSGDGESGFAEENTAWTLPKDQPDNTFQGFSDTLSALPSWTLVDLDGDDLLDVALTEDGTEATGTTSWEMHSGKCR
jgi:hypothetical protein